MNGKKAKSLRAVARLSAAVSNSYTSDSVSKQKVRYEINAEGVEVAIPYTITAVTIRLVKGCERQVYKMLKKNYRESRGVYA